MSVSGSDEVSQAGVSSQSNSKPITSAPILNWTLIILTVVYCFNFIDRQILVIMSPYVKADLGLSDGQLGLVTGLAFALFYTFLGIPIAWYSDRSNRRNIVVASLTIWSAMTAVCGLATNFIQLFLARLGVGIGEAGGSPPSHSMISDLFSVHKRATALAIYSSGIYFGILLGYSIGGVLGAAIGWRMTFMVVGMPGVILAGILWATVKEPARRISAHDIDNKPGFFETIQGVAKFPSFWCFAFACAFSGFVSYGVGNFYPNWLVRYHDLPIRSIGLILGIFMGTSGILGTILGGRLTDWLSKYDIRWYLWLPGLSATMGVPFAIFAFNSDNLYMALGSLYIAAVLGTMYLGPSIATAHRLVEPRMRAMSSAILFFTLNLIGLGLGPTAVGYLSDFLTKINGRESLHLAMTCGTLFALVKAGLFYYGGVLLPKDLAKTKQASTDD